MTGRRVADLVSLADKVQALPTHDKLLLAISFLEKGDIRMAEVVTAIALTDMEAYRLLAPQVTERR